MVELIDLRAKFQNNSDDQVLILTRIADSVDACNDKPVWALNQITVLQEVAKAHACNDKPVWALSQFTVLQKVAKARGNR